MSDKVEQKNEDIFVTKHAYERMKERMGLNKKAAKRLAYRAHSDGISYDDVTGRLRNYILAKARCIDVDGTEVYVYGEYMYVYSHKEEWDALLTVYQMPHIMRKQGIVRQKKMVMGIREKSCLNTL